MAPPMVQLYHNRNVNKNSLLFKVDYTSIGSKAFYTCTSLISVKYRGTVYDTKSVLEAVLVANGVNVSADAFEKTALK